MARRSKSDFQNRLLQKCSFSHFRRYTVYKMQMCKHDVKQHYRNRQNLAPAISADCTSIYIFHTKNMSQLHMLYFFQLQCHFVSLLSLGYWGFIGRHILSSRWFILYYIQVKFPSLLHKYPSSCVFSQPSTLLYLEQVRCIM